MEVRTASGVEIVNKRTPYGKFLQGFCETACWTGANTVRTAWHYAQYIKTPGCSWVATGKIVGKMLRFCADEGMVKTYFDNKKQMEEMFED